MCKMRSDVTASGIYFAGTQRMAGGTGPNNDFDEDASFAPLPKIGEGPLQLLSCSGDFLCYPDCILALQGKKEGPMTDCRMDIL